MINIRVGFGFDVHPLGEGRELWLGGIKLEFDRGCVGHSDADVLLHAVCDALLGAANLRDIGFAFCRHMPIPSRNDIRPDARRRDACQEQCPVSIIRGRTQGSPKFPGTLSMPGTCVTRSYAN